MTCWYQAKQIQWHVLKFHLFVGLSSIIEPFIVIRCTALQKSRVGRGQCHFFATAVIHWTLECRSLPLMTTVAKATKSHHHNNGAVGNMHWVATQEITSVRLHAGQWGGQHVVSQGLSHWPTQGTEFILPSVKSHGCPVQIRSILPISRDAPRMGTPSLTKFEAVPEEVHQWLWLVWLQTVSLKVNWIKLMNQKSFTFGEHIKGCSVLGNRLVSYNSSTLKSTTANWSIEQLDRIHFKPYWVVQGFILIH